MPCLLQVRLYSLFTLLVNSNRAMGSALPPELERGVALLVMKVFYPELGDLFPPRTHLKAYGKNGAIAESLERVFRRDI